MLAGQPTTIISRCSNRLLVLDGRFFLALLAVSSVQRTIVMTPDEENLGLRHLGLQAA